MEERMGHKGEEERGQREMGKVRGKKRGDGPERVRGGARKTQQGDIVMVYVCFKTFCFILIEKFLWSK